ncbi:MAG: AAA family ATPase [Halorhodospira sp.]
MLVEFTVTNFRSFSEPQTLSLVASRQRGHEAHGLLPSDDPKVVPDLLRGAAIYGPNASGKSNLIKALGNLRHLVLQSAKESQAGEPVAVTPFHLRENSGTEPTELEVHFIQEGARYQYGVAATPECIEEEWLIAYPPHRRVQKGQTWFHRRYDPERKRMSWKFGEHFRGKRKLLTETTRDNALFLSTAAQLNHRQLMPVFQWFQERLGPTIQPPGLHPGRTIERCEDSQERERILDFLRQADPDIIDVQIESRPFSSDALPETMPKELKAKIGKDLEGSPMKRVWLTHESQGTGAQMQLPLGDESAGTQRLFSWAGPWLDVLDRGMILFVDELDNSMHPLLVRHLLHLIQSPETNPHGAQIVLTTHDTGLLGDRDLLRRDQVWFTEKGQDGATELRPLTDYRPRKEEALEAGYLRGRYGAVPMLDSTH